MFRQVHKSRGSSVLTAGVGFDGVNITELLAMSSTPSDQYLIDDFYQISVFLNTLTKSTCQQPAKARAETGIKADVVKDSYRYFKYSIGLSNFSKFSIN